MKLDIETARGQRFLGFAKSKLETYKDLGIPAKTMLVDGYTIRLQTGAGGLPQKISIRSPETVAVAVAVGDDQLHWLFADSVGGRLVPREVTVCLYRDPETGECLDERPVPRWLSDSPNYAFPIRFAALYGDAVTAWHAYSSTYVRSTRYRALHVYGGYPDWDFSTGAYPSRDPVESYLGSGSELHLDESRMSVLSSGADRAEIRGAPQYLGPETLALIQRRDFDRIGEPDYIETVAIAHSDFDNDVWVPTSWPDFRDPLTLQHVSFIKPPDPNAPLRVDCVTLFEAEFTAGPDGGPADYFYRYGRLVWHAEASGAPVVDSLEVFFEGDVNDSGAAYQFGMDMRRMMGPPHEPRKNLVTFYDPAIGESVTWGLWDEDDPTTLGCLRSKTALLDVPDPDDTKGRYRWREPFLAGDASAYTFPGDVTAPDIVTEYARARLRWFLVCREENANLERVVVSMHLGTPWDGWSEVPLPAGQVLGVHCVQLDPPGRDGTIEIAAVALAGSEVVTWSYDGAGWTETARGDLPDALNTSPARGDWTVGPAGPPAAARLAGTAGMHPLPILSYRP